MAKSRIWITTIRDSDAAFISGWPAKDLLDEVGSRPVWSPRRRAWAVGNRTAENVAALCDFRGIPVDIAEEVA